MIIKFDHITFVDSKNKFREDSIDTDRLKFKETSLLNAPGKMTFMHKQNKDADVYFVEDTIPIEYVLYDKVYSKTNMRLENNHIFSKVMREAVEEVHTLFMTIGIQHVSQRAHERIYDLKGVFDSQSVFLHLEILVDKIYQNRENLAYCKERGIRLSGPALGRPKKDRKADKKIEAKDNKDRIEVERAFSLAKRNYALGLLKTKLDTTIRSSVALSIIAMNVEQISRTFLHLFSEQIIWRNKQCFSALSDKKSKPLAEPAAC